MTQARIYTPPPTIKRFMQSDAFFKMLMGPVGGGKSVGCVMEIIRRCKEMPPGADGIRRSRWAVVRNTANQLKDTTLKTWFEWVPDGVAGKWKESEKTFFLEFGDVKAEILFRPLDSPDDVRRVLSLELTGCWCNEVREIPREIIEALQGRLRRYPSRSVIREYHSCLIADTNPPEIDSYHYKVMEHIPLDEEDPNTLVPVDSFKQPSGLSPQAENIENLHPDYYRDLAKGKSDDWVGQYIRGEYAPSLSGVPVFGKFFRYDRHVASLPLVPMGDVPVIIGLDFGRCYDDKTEVLTKNGWKLFSAVDPDVDVVATMHPETRHLEYTPINFKVALPYTGDLLEWRGPNVDFCVTPEHVTPYTKRESPNTLRWASAEQLSQEMQAHRYITVAARGWTGQPMPRLPLGMSEEDYAEFLGWWMSDGCVSQTHNTVSIAQKKSAPALAALLNRMSVYGLTIRHKQNVHYFSNAEMANHLRAIGVKHAGERRVPDSIRFASRRVIERFVDAYTAGDGHIRVSRRGKGSSSEHTIWFNNAEIAGQFQELALKLGWSSSVRWQKGGISTFADGRKVVCAGGWVVHFKKKWERVELLPSQFKRVPYNGIVYCLNVPYHTLYVRRNGRPCWNGNTPAAVFGQVTQDGHIEIQHEEVNFDIGFDKFIKYQIRPVLRNMYPSNPIVFIGDPAGKKRNDTDEGSCMKMLRDEFKVEGATVKGAMTNYIAPRLEAVEKLLAYHPDGTPLLRIDARCRWLTEALRSKYRYRLVKDKDADHANEPDKNKWSHVADACQYFALFVLSGKYDPGYYRREDIIMDINPLNMLSNSQRPHRSYAGY